MTNHDQLLNQLGIDEPKARSLRRIWAVSSTMVLAFSLFMCGVSIGAWWGHENAQAQHQQEVQRLQDSLGRALELAYGRTAQQATEIEEAASVVQQAASDAAQKANDAKQAAKQASEAAKKARSAADEKQKTEQGPRIMMQLYQQPTPWLRESEPSPAPRPLDVLPWNSNIHKG